MIQSITDPCSSCGEGVKRQIGTAETGRLLTHTTKCLGNQQDTVLDDFSITGGSMKLTANEVHERVALWVSESACPFIIIKDRQVSSVKPYLSPYQAEISFHSSNDSTTPMCENTYHIGQLLAWTSSAYTRQPRKTS